MLPNFLIIGAARSGTTSLYHNLRAHPDIYMPVKKEPQFFTANWHRGLEWYERLFEDWQGEKAVGEASMTYTYPDFADVPRRIVQYLPEVRFIYMLRNPVERTYSHYLYYRYYRGDEKLSFKDAIEQKPIYLGTSQYYTWLQRYLQYFPRQCFHIVIFEEYVTKPEHVIENVFHFLGVDPSFRPATLRTRTNQAFSPRNERFYQLWRRFSLSTTRLWLEKYIPESWRPRLRNVIHRSLGTGNIPPMSQEAKVQLKAFFEPQIVALEEILERDLNLWRT